MRKFLVALLILSVMGGVFAQEEWTISGEASASTSFDFTAEGTDEDPLMLKGAGAVGEVAFLVAFEKGPWTLNLPFKFKVSDASGSAAFGDDPQLVYSENIVTVTLAFKDNINKFSLKAVLEADDYGFTAGISNINLASHKVDQDAIMEAIMAGDEDIDPDSIVTHGMAATGISHLFGWYDVGPGTLGVNYKAAEFDWFRTSWVNVVDTFFWDRFEGVGYKVVFGDISAGLMLGGLFAGSPGEEEAIKAFQKLSFGVKYDAFVTFSAMFGIEPGENKEGEDAIDAYVYAGVKHKLLDMVALSFDISAGILAAADDPFVNLGFSATYGAADSYDPYAKLLFTATDVATDPHDDYFLGLYAAYNFHSDDGAGDGVWANALFEIPNLMLRDEEKMNVNLRVEAGYKGGLLDGALTYNAGVALYGRHDGEKLALTGGAPTENAAESEWDKFLVDLDIFAEADYLYEDIFTNWDFGIGIDVALKRLMSQDSEEQPYGGVQVPLTIEPYLKWKIKPNQNIKITYTIGSTDLAPNPAPDNLLDVNKLVISYNWKF